jgi:hypothetical protein
MLPRPPPPTLFFLGGLLLPPQQGTTCNMSKRESRQPTTDTVSSSCASLIHTSYCTSILQLSIQMSLVPALVKYPAVRWAAAGWSFFIAENALLSENRTWLIEELGDERYHLVYGTLSTVATASIGYAYYSIRKMAMPSSLILRTIAPKVVSIPILGGWISLSMGMIMASQAAPKMQIPFALVTSSSTDGDSSASSRSLKVLCPFDFSDKKKSAGDESSLVEGLERITRHPGLWSFGFIGLGQAFLAATIPQRIWWCGPAAVAWLGGAHTDSRFRRGMGGTLAPEYECQTSNIPFWALVSGKQGSGSWKVLAEDIKPLNAAVAVGASSLWVLRRVVK